MLIKDGVVAGSEQQGPVDVLVEGGTIVAIGRGLGTDANQIVDASGCLIGPGFVDLHVHFRDPGQTWKEDVESGSRSAVAGGFTAAVMMPNTDPPLDNVPVASDLLDRSADIGLLELTLAGALSVGRSGVDMADIEGLYGIGIRMFSDDGDSVASDTLMEECMRTVAQLQGAFVSEHAEDSSLTGDGHMHAGQVASDLEIGGLPSEAEDRIVRRDIDLAQLTGCRLHMQHLSTAGSVELISKAKSRGQSVTAEVAPHHLALVDEDLLGLNTNLKMYPPLRSRSDREALRSALSSGVIDAVATDHAPHSAAEKDVPFSEAPRGVIGLETSAAVAWECLDGDAGLFFERMSIAPARIGGFERQGISPTVGAPANLVVWDPARTWAATEFASKSSNSPFLGGTLTGKVRYTIYEGKMVYDDGSN